MPLTAMTLERTFVALRILDEDETLSMLQSMIKQRRESIVMYEKGGRAELAEQEAVEIGIIQTFLPEQMDEAAVSAAVQEVISELSATSLKDMGKVMGAVKTQLAGKADMGQVSAAVKAGLQPSTRIESP